MSDMIDFEIIKALIKLVVDLWNSSSEVKIRANLSKAVCKEAHDYLHRKYDGWGEIVEQAVRQGIGKAAELLQNAKESILGFIQENKEEFLKILTQRAVKHLIVKCVTKEIAREGTKKVVTSGAKSAVTQGGKQLASQATKQIATQGLKMSRTCTGIGTIANLAQTGLEYYGYKEEGKVVGAAGNVASGALLGSVAGPPGIAIGALGGFLIWGAGEIVGKIIDKFF